VITLDALLIVGQLTVRQNEIVGHDRFDFRHLRRRSVIFEA
jgi:hypothetical protein